MRRRSTTDLAVAAVTALLISACSKPAAPVAERGDSASASADPATTNTNTNTNVTDDPDDSQEPSMTTIRDAAGIQSHDGQVVQLVGRYSVSSTGRHKIMFTLPDGTTGSTNQLVQIGLEGDVWVKVGGRPDEEMEELKGKTVAVTGKLIASPTRKGPGAQPDPQPTLVQVTSIVEQP